MIFTPCLRAINVSLCFVASHMPIEEESKSRKLNHISPQTPPPRPAFIRTHNHHPPPPLKEMTAKMHLCPARTHHRHHFVLDRMVVKGAGGSSLIKSSLTHTHTHNTHTLFLFVATSSSNQKAQSHTRTDTQRRHHDDGNAPP